MITKYKKLISIILAITFICTVLLFFGNVFEWKLPPIKIFEWDFIPFKISNDFNQWSSFGNYLGGVLGVTFSFIIILTLFIFEKERDERERKKQAISDIFTTIKQNRDLFNTIKSYKGHYPENVGSQYPFGREIWTTISEKTGPEMFENIYKTLTNLFKYAFANEIRSSNTNENLFSSIPDDILFDLYKEEWKKHIQRLKKYKNNEETLKINEEISEIYNNIFDDSKPKSIQIEEFTKIKFNKERPIKKIFLARNPIHKAGNYIDVFTIVKAIRNSFKKLYNKSGYLFGHYFGNQYYVFDTIHSSKELSELEKEKYFKLYRSHLSCYELVLMFYYALSEFSTKDYNDYLIKYNMLDNLDGVHFIHKEFFRKLRKNNNKELLSVVDEINRLNKDV